MYNEFYHFGIPGMKWGIRKYQNADGTRTNAGRRHASRTKKNKKEDISKLSDAELRSKLNRKQMERQYADITEDPKIKAGKKLATAIITGTLIAAGTKYGGKLIASGIKILTNMGA